MTWSVESYNGDIFILFQDVFGKARRCFIVLVTARAMPEENELSDFFAVGGAELAADAAALRVDIIVFFRRCSPKPIASFSVKLRFSKTLYFYPSP